MSSYINKTKSLQRPWGIFVKTDEGVCEKRLRTFKIKGNASEHKQMHRRGEDILSHTKKTNPYIQRTKPRQCSSNLFVETDQRVFQKTSLTFYKQGKQVSPAHAAHKHATLPKYFAGIVHYAHL